MPIVLIVKFHSTPHRYEGKSAVSLTGNSCIRSYVLRKILCRITYTGSSSNSMHNQVGGACNLCMIAVCFDLALKQARIP